MQDGNDSRGSVVAQGVSLTVSRRDAGPRAVPLARGRLVEGAEGGKIRVGLVQINNSFSKQNYLPYSIGLLQGYAQKHLEKASRYEFLLPRYNRIPVEAGVARLRGAEVVGFSTYCWNSRISLEMARRMKEENPAVIIVFGGPHVPNRAEEFLRANPFIPRMELIVC